MAMAPATFPISASLPLFRCPRTRPMAKGERIPTYSLPNCRAPFRIALCPDLANSRNKSRRLQNLKFGSGCSGPFAEEREAVVPISGVLSGVLIPPFFYSPLAGPAWPVLRPGTPHRRGPQKAPDLRLGRFEKSRPLGRVQRRDRARPESIREGNHSPCEGAVEYDAHRRLQDYLPFYLDVGFFFFGRRRVIICSSTGFWDDISRPLPLGQCQGQASRPGPMGINSIPCVSGGSTQLYIEGLCTPATAHPAGRESHRDFEPTAGDSASALQIRGSPTTTHLGDLGLPHSPLPIGRLSLNPTRRWWAWWPGDQTR